ncbi:MAG: A/G-specific adenine glycosylase, partial [Bdellovibrionaceae bacterium]|nr:A/G-specific adenine glycosylase [Pseudobdellovibrionaceae bacterium]
MKTIEQDRKQLHSWYLKNKRNLPWRASKNPYLIWISEVMLQQTTVTAVIPFYEKFIKRFPDINTLAKARIEDVYEYWAGLGYYSRARNLHKAAQIVVHKHKAVFPKTYQELIELPGFGPYTSRAVASLAYDQ